MEFLTVSVDVINQLETYNHNFNEIINEIQVIEPFQYLGYLIIGFIAIKNVIKILTSGGRETVDPFEHIYKPGFYVLILMFAPDILNMIDSLGIAIGKTIESKISFSTVDLQKNFDLAFEKMFNEVKAPSFTRTVVSISTLGVSDAMDYLSVSLLEGLKNLSYWLDSFALFAFWAFAKITWTILKILGILSLILSFTGYFDSIKIWIRSILSVALWMPLAFLVFYIMDKLFFEYISSYLQDIQTNDAYFGYGDVFLIIGILFFFGIMKLIFMFKVPNIINMVVGGASASGGIFGVALAPALMMTKLGGGAAKTAVTKGKK